MRHRTLATITAPLALLAAGTAVAAGAPTTGQTPHATTAKAEYMFIVDGESANLAPVDGQADTYTLTLPIRARRQAVMWFTDRPIRDAGTMRLEAFVGLWKKAGSSSFSADPPNVALDYTAKGTPATIIAAMSQTAIVRTGAKGLALQATLTVIPDNQVVQMAKATTHMGTHAKLADLGALVPTRIGRLSLFVDAYSGTSLKIMKMPGSVGANYV